MGMSPFSKKQNPETSLKGMNVLWIVLDDLGYGDLGCYGCRDIPTPHIDALSREGLLFERFYVTPVCSPTRVQLLTGRYCQDFRLENALVGEHSAALKPDPLMAAEFFKDNGYQTACVGKWHLGNDKDGYPLSQGFERFYGAPIGALDYYKHTYASPHAKSEAEAIVDFYDGWNLCHDKGYTTDLFTDRALREINEAKEAQKPFFLYLAYNAPHYARGVHAGQNRPVTDILQAPESYVRKFAKNPDSPTMREMYAAVVANLDDNLGRIFSSLDTLGLRENTIVVLLSDNGATLPHGGSNVPLNGQKHTLWEGGIRTPLMVRLPEKLGAKRSTRNIKTPWFVRDIFPTVAGLSGVAASPQIGEGVSFGHNRAKEWLAGEDNPQELLRDECLKYNQERAVIRGRWKWLQKKNDTSAQLYDVETDPSETTDVISQHPELAKEMEAAWNRWYAPYAKREYAIAKEELALHQARMDKAQNPDDSVKSGYAWAVGEMKNATHWINITGHDIGVKVIE